MPFVDFHTNCETFSECLWLIREWSDAHSGHHLLFVFIEPKDEEDPGGFTGHMGEVDAEILSVWPLDRLFTPDDLLRDGDYETLLQAVLDRGWPTLGETRNRAMFVLLDSGSFRDEYIEDNPTLTGRIMFTRGGAGEPFGGFRNIDDPVEGQDEIREAVRAGYLIRTRADSSCIEAYLNDFSRQEAALTSGAQMISTDFPVPPSYSDYAFEMPDGSPSRCNPVTAPEFCTARDVEDLSSQ